jgi:hypothetical protein
MEKYAAVLKESFRLDLCDIFPEPHNSPIDVSADTMARVGFPVEMLILACFCTRNTIIRLGTQGASEPGLSGDIGGGCRWSRGRRWSYSIHDRDVR